jgi:transposase InsO family protein
MGHFGVPKLVQSDNGSRFVGVLEVQLEREGIKIAHGQPKHPQSQGYVEQGNNIFK